MYDRNVVPSSFPAGQELTAHLVRLGMRFGARPAKSDLNIEDLLIAASHAGVVGYDLRLLSVLTTWLGVHHRIVNVDRLTRVVKALPLEVLRAYWTSMAQWLASSRRDKRWRRLAESWLGDRIELVVDGSFLLQRDGEDERFAEGPLVVPAKVLRDREVDVDAPSIVAARSPAYRARVLHGPRYSADMWALLEQGGEVPAATLAREVYGSYATAVDVLARWRVLTGSSDSETSTLMGA